MGDGATTARARMLVVGRVQGVGFRYATVAEADARRLCGWVRNLPDGRVEIVAQGARSAVTDLIAWCRTGPGSARVFEVDVAWETPGDEPPGFRVA